LCTQENPDLARSGLQKWSTRLAPPCPVGLWNVHSQGVFGCWATFKILYDTVGRNPTNQCIWRNKPFFIGFHREQMQDFWTINSMSLYWLLHDWILVILQSPTYLGSSSMSLSFLLAPKVKPKVDAQVPKTKTLAKAPPEESRWWIWNGPTVSNKMKETLVTLVYSQN